MMAFFSSVRGRLLLTLVAALVPALVVLLISRGKIREQMVEDAVRQLHSFAVLLAQREQQLADAARQILTFLSEFYGLERHHPRACADLYKKVLHPRSFFENLGAADRKGQVFCSARPFARSVSLRGRDWFHRTLTSGKFQRSNLCQDPVTDQPALLFAYPIRKKDGDMEGVVYASVRPEWLLRPIVPVPMPKDSVVTVIDSGGKIIVRQPAQGVQWTGRSAWGEKGLLVLSQHPNKTFWTDQSGNDIRLFVASRLGVGWLVVSVPQSSVTAMPDEILHQHFLALLLGGLASLLMAWVGSSWSLGRSLRPLLTATRRLREGDWSARVGHQVPLTEFRELASGFDQMAADLEAQSAEAEERLRRLEGLHEMNKELIQCRSVEELTSVIAQHLTRLFHCAGASVSLPDSTEMRVAVRTVATAAGPTQTVRHPTSFVGYGRSNSVNFAGSSLSIEGLKPLVKVPIPINSQKDAFLELLDLTHKEVREEEVEALRGLAQHTAIAWERVSLFQRVSKQVRWTESLIRIIRSAHMRLDPDSIARTALQELEILLPDTALMIATEEGEGQLPVIRSFNEKASPLVKDAESRSLTEVVAKGLQRGDRSGSSRLILLNELRASDGPVFSLLSRHRFTSFLLADISVGSERLGTLLAAKQDAIGFTTEQCEYARSVCNHLAIAFHNARLLKEWERAYRDLQAAQKVLVHQERLHALGQMASGVAHDIRNALVPLVASLELLESHPAEDVRQMVGTLRKVADDIVHIVTRLQVFYRRKAREEEMEPVNLNSIVNEAVDLTRPKWYDTANREGVTINVRTDLRQDLPIIAAVGSEIREALINLIFNAVDAILAKREKDGSLTLKTGLRDQYAVIEVTDSGIGMDEQTKQACLEPFFTTKGEKGTGLGLTMVASIVERHDGLLEIESQPQVGTTFRLLIPARSFEKTLGPTEEEKPLRRFRVLLVDDDPRVRASLERILNQLGQSVVSASNGVEALHLFRQSLDLGPPFDFVITDLGMPVMSGEELIRTIKSLSPNTPVVAISGWAAEASPEGADLFLSKPLHFSDLRKAILTLSSSFLTPHHNSRFSS